MVSLPASLLYDLEHIPVDRPVSLLLRHSIRFPIPSIELTYQIGLTEEGVRLAEELGVLLAGRFQPGRLMSSPVERCIDTVKAIARGAGWLGEVQTDERLSHPFISPAYSQVEQGKANVMLPPQVRATLGLLLYQSKPGEYPARLDMMATHDTIVAAVAGSLLHAPVLGPDWPNFLEGIFVWREGEHVRARWRGEERVFTKQFTPVEAQAGD